MATDYDDIVERLTERAEFEANLLKVFDADELEEQIKNSFDSDSRRATLEKHKDDLFETSTIQKEVVENFKVRIKGSTDVDDLILIPKEIPVRIQSKFDEKAKEIVSKSKSINDNKVSNLRGKIEDTSSFDTVVGEKKIEFSNNIDELRKIGEEIPQVGHKAEGKRNELLKEQPFTMKREDLLKQGFDNRSLKKVSGILGLSREKATKLFERENFTIDKRGRIRK